MSNNTKNPLKVITGPATRWSFANVWEPKSINGGTPKYSVSLIIPKSDTATVAKIKAAIEAARPKRCRDSSDDWRSSLQIGGAHHGHRLQKQ